jgi:hypothetical protein
MKSKKTKSHQQLSPYPVIITGCPYSGWGMALSALGHLKFEDAGASASNWLDLVFEKAEQDNPLKFDSNFEPDFSQLNASFKTEAATGLADDRYIYLLEQCASQYPNARFLLFYTRAEIALASAIEKSADPDEFIKVWSQANQRLIQFQRRYRDRALLFDSEAVASKPSEFAQSCLLIGLEPTEIETDLPETPVLYPGSIERLIARHLLSDAADVLSLQDELEASATPLGSHEGGKSQNLTKVIDAYLQHSANLDRVTRDRDENAQLAEDRQQQLKVIKAERDKKVKAVKAGLGQLKQLKQEAEVVQQAKLETKQESELLLLQLHQVQKELEAIFLDKQQLEKDQKIAEAEYKKLKKLNDKVSSEQETNKTLLAETTKNLDELKQQNSKLSSEHQTNKQNLTDTNKILGELKQELNKTKQDAELRNKTQSEITQENELLLLQLHQVQEELERYYLLYQESTKKAELAEAETAKLATEQEDEIASIEKVEDTNSTGFLGVFGGSKAKAKKRMQEKIRLVNESGLIDKKWYLSQYPDVAEANYEPVKHYLRFGAAEERDPSPDFSTSYYIRSNPDILKSGVNPLVHYIRFGRDEGRLPRDMSAE